MELSTVLGRIESCTNSVPYGLYRHSRPLKDLRGSKLSDLAHEQIDSIHLCQPSGLVRETNFLSRSGASSDIAESGRWQGLSRSCLSVDPKAPLLRGERRLAFNSGKLAFNIQVHLYMGSLLLRKNSNIDFASFNISSKYSSMKCCRYPEIISICI